MLLCGAVVYAFVCASLYAFVCSSVLCLRVVFLFGVVLYVSLYASVLCFCLC